MFLKNIVTVAGLAIASVGIMAIGNVQSANAAACGAAWASPGTYKITGNFRGKPESAGAERREYMAAPAALIVGWPRNADALQSLP